MADILLLTGAILLIIAGIIGCLLPVLPGPPLSFAGVLLLHFSGYSNDQISLFGSIVSNKTILVIMAIVALAATILDYIVPIWGTKKLGGSKYGIRGATVGLVIGLFLGPIGIIAGPFAGAVVGELIYRDDLNYAFRAGFGALIGFMMGVGLKLLASGIITITFFKMLSFKS